MTAADRCPPDADLEEFLLGRCAPGAVDALERHLAGCSTCVERATGLSSADRLVAGVRRAAAVPAAVPPLAAELTAVFRQLVPSAVGSTAAWVADVVEVADAAADTGRVGPYLVSEVLGAGGMGVVYRGFDPALERAVAVKVIRPGLVAAEGMADRFLAEARAAAKVENDHIVAVHSVEVHDGRPCLVMPLLKGETLDARLARGRRLPAGEVVRVGREAAAALAAAHAAGLVHRDIKPGNLWLEAGRDRLKVLDFGLAVAAGGGSVGFAGTPGYMAPEQVRGAAVDHRADLFSLGCVLYRAAAGVGPFDADSASAAVIRTLTRPPAGVRAVNPAVPAELAAVIDGLLARDPAARPESAAAVADRLDAIAAGWRRRSTRRRWLAGLTAAAGLGGLAAWFAHEPPPAPVPPVEVTLVADPDVGPLVLTGGEATVRVEPGDRTVTLPPGNYTVMAAATATNRVPVPGAFVLEPGTPRRVAVALVGEVEKITTHAGAVTGVAAVPAGGGFAVLSASLDKTLRRWQPGASGEQPFAPLPTEARFFAATADGALVLAAGGLKQRDADGSFRLGAYPWDGRTLTPAGGPVELHRGYLDALAVSADGTRAVSADNREALVWAPGGRAGVPLAGYQGRLTAAAVNATGKRVLAGAANGAAYVWDVTKPGEPRTFVPPGPQPATVRAVAFLPDGYVTAGEDGVVWVWDRDFRPREFRAGERKATRAVAASADGKRLLAAGDDGAVRLWSVARGEVEYAFAGHAGPVRGVAFTPDGRGAVSGAEDWSVRVWRLPFE